MQTYNRISLLIERGIGCRALDIDGNSYLDLAGALGTCSVGYCNEEVNSAIIEQIRKIITTTNLYYTEPQIKLSQKLALLSSLDKSFFSNSGAEANETAIKLARKHTGKPGIIAADGGFHGRTFGALSATSKAKYTEPFKPLVPGFMHIPYNDSEALRKAVTEDTAAFIVEPIQGEAGVIVPHNSYLKAVREICDEKGILLIADEVQTGNGRTGKYFCYQHSKIKPDIVTSAKGLANGVPIGVTIAAEEIADSFGKGDHGSTFGGNPLACTAALATIAYMEKNGLVEKANNKGAIILKNLAELKSKSDLISQFRGKGLMAGMDIIVDAENVAEKCIKKGLLINKCTEKTLRMLPSLTITEAEILEGMDILHGVLK